MVYKHISIVLVLVAMIDIRVCTKCDAKAKKATPITYDKAYVDPLFGFEEFKEDFKKRNIVFKKIGVIKAALSVDLYNCFGGGWETDPGDFRKVIIKSSNGFLAEYDNANGWDRVSKVSLLPRLPTQSKTIKKLNYCITLDMGEGNSIVALFGHPYDNEPGLLTLIYVGKGTSEIIFNKHFDVFEIKEQDQGYSLIGRLHYEENYADPYEIAIKDGKLTFGKLLLQKVYESKNPHIILHNAIGWAYSAQPGEFTRLEIAAPPESKVQENHVFHVTYYNDTWTPFPKPVQVPAHTTTIQQTPYFIMLENQNGRIIILSRRKGKEITSARLSILESSASYPTSLFNGYFHLQEIREDDKAYHLLGTVEIADDPHKIHEITINKASMAQVECDW